MNLLSLSLAPRGTFFSGYSGFPLLLKNQHFQIPIRSRMAVICAWHKIPHIRVIIRRPSVLVSEDFRRLTQIPADCQRNSEDYRRCPKTVKDVQRQPKISEEKSGNFPRADWIDCFCVCVCVWVFHFSFSWKTLQITTGVFSGNMETVNINKLANLTVNTKTYGYITLGIKPHSDPQLMSLKNELPYMSVIILGEIFLFLDDFWWRIF